MFNFDNFPILSINVCRNEEAQSSPLLPSVPEVAVPTSSCVVDNKSPSAMTGASKELSPEKVHNEQFVDARPIDEGIISSIYSFVKKAATVGKTNKFNINHIGYKINIKLGIVYLVGYMGWSVAWLIGPVILSVIRDQWRRQSDQRRNDAKTIAQADERRVILARLNDLPSWVCKIFMGFFLLQ